MLTQTQQDVLYGFFLSHGFFLIKGLEDHRLIIKQTLSNKEETKIFFERIKDLLGDLCDEDIIYSNDSLSTQLRTIKTQEITRFHKENFLQDSWQDRLAVNFKNISSLSLAIWFARSGRFYNKNPNHLKLALLLPKFNLEQVKIIKSLLEEKFNDKISIEVSSGNKTVTLLLHYSTTVKFLKLIREDYLSLGMINHHNSIFLKSDFDSSNYSIAEELTLDERKEIKLTDVQKSVLIGSLLGDGHLTRSESKTANSYLQINRAEKDINYLLWERDIFENIVTYANVVTKNYISRTHNKKFKTSILSTISLPELREFRNKWYSGPGETKIVPRDLVLDDLIVAIWIADDGSLSRVSSGITLIISTNGFEKSDVEFLKELLDKKYQISMKIVQPKKKVEQFILSVRGNDLFKLAQKVIPVFPPGIDRKLNILKLCKYSEKSFSYKASSELKRKNLFSFLEKNSQFTYYEICKELKFLIKNSKPNDDSYSNINYSILKYLNPYLRAGIVSRTKNVPKKFLVNHSILQKLE